jgi:protein TonB
MRVLIACEYSGRVRDAFRRHGHDAWSCDLLECESDPRWHYQAPVETLLANDWDLMVAHPPCTHLAVSGSRHFHRKEREQAELLTRTKQTLAKLNASHNTNKDPAIERQRQQLINLLAQIEKRIQEENARPRKRYVSPSTQEASFARYYDLLRRKIEAKGTLDFPQSQGQKLYGSLIMVITIDTRGHVISADVSQGSGNPLLDFHAKQIARNAGPYGAFSDAMRREMDQLALVTRFSFDHNNTLQTTLQGE